MRIDILQVKSEGKNEFVVNYDGKLQYKAKLPFISIKDPLKLEKLREITIFDTSGNKVYTTDYKYVENLKEEIIPFKFLITGSQKYNQLLFTSSNGVIKIYEEQKALFYDRYVIEINDKQYFCYSIEDGYIRHFPIYDGEVQIGECLKSGVIVGGKDEYCCYLKEGYKNISDGIVALLLYLDRSEYSSSYLANNSYYLPKSFSYNSTNKYYNREWVKDNFGDDYYKKVDEDVKFVKEKFKHPFKTAEEQWDSMPESRKKIMTFILIAPWALMFIFLLFVFIIILFSN